MSRILLLHASVGMGHYRAALALEHAFDQIDGVVANVEDTLKYAHTIFRKAYAGSYLSIADYMPMVWSQFYAQTDRRLSPLHPVAGIRSLSTTLGVDGLSALLAETRPDAIVCTHFLPAEVLGLQRSSGRPPLYMVVTDYRAHHFWVCPGVDGYFVPTDMTRDQVVRAGVPSSQVHVTGIPVDPLLAEPGEQQTARQDLDLAPRQPVVLLSGSGIASRRVREMAEALITAAMPGTLLIATGRNHALLTSLANLESTYRTTVRVVGPQPSLDPLIVASDVVIGKAGGLTVSEVLARGRPLVIPTPVPGQEQWNAAHVVQGGAGLCCATATEVAQTVTGLLHDPTRRRAYADAARRLGRPLAAQIIATHVLAGLPQRAVPRPFTPALRPHVHA
jgi:processive 1,2-diacylglycerol beta-glucosyltransferase